MTDPLEIALDLVDHGMPVFHARPNPNYGKTEGAGEFHLPVQWQDHGPDWDVIDAWAEGDALCLVAGHGLDGVDIDPRNGSSVDEQHDRLVALGVPIVAMTRTPGKGAHFYVPSVGLCSSSNQATGVDFRGRGLDHTGTGFLYLPGTFRPKYDGGGYTWEIPPRWEILDDLADDEDRRNEIRDALAAYLTGNGIRPRTHREDTPAEVIGGEHVDHEHLRPWLRELIADTGPTWETASGGTSQDRSERFHHLVGACRRAQLTQGQAVTVLEPWCAAVGKYVGRVADEVARSWPKVAPTEGDTMRNEIPPATAAEDDTDDDAPPSSWRPVDLTAYLDGTYVPPEATMLPRIDGVHLIYPGKVHSFHGESESGKSLILQAEMVRVIRSGGRVLMLDFEDDAGSVIPRMLRMGATPEELHERFDYVRPDESPHATNDSMDAYADILAQRYDLAVIDGVTDAMGLWTGGMGSSNDNDALAAFLRAFPRRLATRTGAAVCLIDHVAKDPEKRGRTALGGVAKMNGLDGAAYVVEVDQVCGVGVRGVLVLRIGKDRPGVIRPRCGNWRKSDRTQEAARIVVDSTQDNTTVVTVEPPRSNDPGEAFRPTTLMERVSLALSMDPEPLSTRKIREAVKGQAEAIDQAVRVLVAEGYITQSRGARGAVLHTSVRPYRQADDPESDAYLGSMPGATVSGTHTSTTSTTTGEESDRDRVPLYRGGHRTRSGMGDSSVSGTQSGHGQDTVEMWDPTEHTPRDEGVIHACAGTACNVVGCEAGAASA